METILEKNKMSGNCIKCGTCCTNPSIVVPFENKEDARFFSYFGIVISQNGEKYYSKISLQSTCRHYDAEEGCMIYEKRPETCKIYPTNNIGTFETCGYKNEK